MHASHRSAFLLVSHGSRDPRPDAAIAQLVTQLQHHTTADTPPAHQEFAPLIGAATLELADEPLHRQIEQMAYLASTEGYTRLNLLPLFLLPGVHVMDDIPAEIDQAQQLLAHSPAADIELHCCPYLGSHLGLVQILQTTQQQAEMDAWILLSHGSRRERGNQPIEQLAEQIQAVPAYWSVEPQLADQVECLIEQGKYRIGILPYFLFAGGITDAIATSVNELAQRHPQARFQLAPVLSEQAALLPYLVDLMQISDPQCAIAPR